MNKYLDLLQLSCNSSVKELQKYKLVMAYKSPRYIMDTLVKSKFSETLEFQFSYFKCKRPRCTHCARNV